LGSAAPNRLNARAIADVPDRCIPSTKMQFLVSVSGRLVGASLAASIRSVMRIQ